MTSRALYIPRSTSAHRIRREISAYTRTLNMLARRAISEMSGEDWAFLITAAIVLVAAWRVGVR